MKPAPAISILSKISTLFLSNRFSKSLDIIRALSSSAILRGGIRKTFALCMAKLVAKSPNSFFGGTSNAISGKASENFNEPSCIADSTAALIAAAIFSLVCKFFPLLRTYKKL